MQCASCLHDLPGSAKFCPNCGTRVAALAADEGERRQATILFSDLSGYTTLNERLDPEEVEAIMERVKREAAAIIEQHGGIINQFVGDEVVALFGIPLARRNDPRRAVDAARALHDAVRLIGVEIEARIGCALAMHSGINTGLIVTRRSDSRDGRFALTGDTVNTGARLLGLAAADEIVVGPDTWRQVSVDFTAEEGAPIEVKGKERPVTPYRIRERRIAAEAKRRDIVGRARELQTFAACADACGARAAGQVLVLRGDPGIGKTRLLAEFADIAQKREFVCHAALVLDFSGGRGGDAIRNLARSLLGIGVDAGEAASRSALEQALAGGWVVRERELFLGDLLDVAARAELRALDAAMTVAARERGTEDTLVELIVAVASRSPLMLTVEDVHWADARTLKRLAAIGRITARLPLVLVLTTRIDGDPTAPEWRAAMAGARVTDIDLAPLSAENAVEFAAQFCGFSAAAARSLIERAEGNPLFLEQLLLNAEGAAQTTIPGSIHSLVLARIDRLPVADKQAFQAASVLGQRFSLETLRHLLDSDAIDCRVLAEHQLVRPDGTDWLFSHALIREGAYESLLKSRRRQLHARAAEWFAARDRSLSAEHFERAEDARAANAYLGASEAEAARYHYDGALALAERGLALAATREDRYALTSMRARVLLDAGRPQESIAAAQAALAAAQEPGERANALIGVAAGMRIVDRVEEALAALALAEPLARAADSRYALARLHHLRGGFYFGLGRPDDCMREHEAALADARAAGSIEAEANALSGLGDANYVRGRVRTAHARFRDCVELAHRGGLGRIEVANRHMVAWTLHYLGNLGPALDMAQEAVAMAASVSHQRTEAVARQSVAYIQGWLMGEVEPAHVQLDRALVLVQSLGAKRFEAQNLVFRAQLVLRAGELANAYALIRDALAYTRAHGMSFIGPLALGVLAQATPDAAERSRALAEGEALLALGGLSHNYFDFYACAIDAALAAGSWDEAERYCAGIERYTLEEPLAWSDLVAARGRALARYGRGERGADLVARIKGLRDQAAQSSFDVWVPALDGAIRRVESEMGI